MPSLPRPAAGPPETVDEMPTVILAPRKSKRRPAGRDRFEEIPTPKSQLTDEAKEAGFPWLDIENPLVWRGGIGEDE